MTHLSCDLFFVLQCSFNCMSSNNMYFFINYVHFNHLHVNRPNNFWAVSDCPVLANWGLFPVTYQLFLNENFTTQYFILHMYSSWSVFACRKFVAGVFCFLLAVNSLPENSGFCLQWIRCRSIQTHLEVTLCRVPWALLFWRWFIMNVYSLVLVS